MENDLLATTSEQSKETKSKFGTQKNLLSLTSQSKNLGLIDHVICHMTIFLKILKLTKLVVGLSVCLFWLFSLLGVKYQGRGPCYKSHI